MSALPELPEPIIPASKLVESECGSLGPLFGAEQMREYGDAMAAHARKAALEETARTLMITNLSALQNEPQMLHTVLVTISGMAELLRSLK